MQDVASAEILPNLEFRHYLELPFASQSQLTTLRKKSPAHLRYEREQPRRETPALMLGSAIHCALLEPDEYFQRYAIAPKANLATKKGQATFEAWLGEPLPERIGDESQFEAIQRTHKRIVLRAEEAEKVARIADGASKSKAVQTLIGGASNFEESVIWSDPETGVSCKARLDAHLMGKRGPVVIDLKSSEDASPYAWEKEIGNRLYHIQAAFYVDGLLAALAANGSEYSSGTFLHLVYEKAPPYACAVHRMPSDAMEVGRREYRRLLKLWRRCVDDDSWGDYSERIFTTGLPRWYKEYDPEEQGAF